MTLDRKLSNTTQADLLSAFRLFDGDKDNRVNAGEVLALIESFGGQKDCPQVQNLVRACEQNKDGSLDLEEFLQQWRIFCRSNMADEEPEEEILEAFRGYDLDQDGFITRDEMVEVLKRIIYQG
ncbi:calmodulin isoform X2 [Eurytemora carolleeae]|uniref:calmodulin isoform X2 n=1 Tax=Eurytemora carolleeae TaxID=1294199 RepID=UPI000C778777|nr:calmodulin isoform X2 [Eurytemora carolleeae]|eukprot:XP_023325000.1 calmodulin-like isoform X2 [Eurytemora affinis]